MPKPFKEHPADLTTCEVKPDTDMEIIIKMTTAWLSWNVHPRQVYLWLNQLGVKEECLIKVFEDYRISFKNKQGE